MTQTWLRAYGAHFQTQADCSGAIDFPLDFVTGKWARFQAGGPAEVDAIRRKPAMLAEGLCDRAILPEIAFAHFRAAFSGGAVVELQDAGHFCQEDQPGNARRPHRPVHSTHLTPKETLHLTAAASRLFEGHSSPSRRRR